MIAAQPLTADAFRPFGDVIETGGAHRLINEGQCRRYHDLAALDFVQGAAGISMFRSEIRALPYACDLMERHPEGSQAFLPMDGSDYLVIVAPDAGGVPGAPIAFAARSDQGVNYARGTWHGVLAPVSGGGLFAVVDRIGPGANLEEYRMSAPVQVSADVIPGIRT